MYRIKSYVLYLYQLKNVELYRLRTIEYMKKYKKFNFAVGYKPDFVIK